MRYTRAVETTEVLFWGKPYVILYIGVILISPHLAQTPNMFSVSTLMPWPSYEAIPIYSWALAIPDRRRPIASVAKIWMPETSWASLSTRCWRSLCRRAAESAHKARPAKRCRQSCGWLWHSRIEVVDLERWNSRRASGRSIYGTQRSFVGQLSPADPVSRTLSRRQRSTSSRFSGLGTEACAPKAGDIHRDP